MHPYLPFAALPIAVAAAWFAASGRPVSEPGRYRIPPVTQIEEPSIPAVTRGESDASADIRVAAFLPKIPPRPPAPEPTLILHSVMTGSDANLVSINGQVLRTGDRIEGYTVAQITAEGVELALADKVRYLPMRPLHELPPPRLRGTDPSGTAPATKDPDALTQNFWATFDSSQPEI
jgi:hypothetical protein